MNSAVLRVSPAFPASPQLCPASQPRTDWRPEQCLELANGCLERVHMMSSLQINVSLCKYLINKLDWAVQQAREVSKMRSLPLELGRLLLVSATDVETFVDGCGEHRWLLSALTMLNPSEFVLKVNYELDFLGAVLSCSISRDKSSTSMTSLTEKLDSLNIRRNAVDYRIRLWARLEQLKLLEKTKVLVESSEILDLKHRMATVLLGRLTAARAEINGSGESLPLKSWKIDYRSLEPQERLGAGTASIVHKTEWLGVAVAKKTFFVSDHSSFEGEVSNWAPLCHPNIVHLFGYAKGDGNCSLVMELMDEDLFHFMRTRLLRDRSLTYPFMVSEAVDIMLQIAEAMMHLHEQHILHRDLKSRNVLVKHEVSDLGTNHIHVKLADFGFSRTKLASSTYLNTTTWATGTTRWRAPELINFNDLRVAPKCLFKSDVYSFGMACYEILTGRLPFHDTSSPNEVMTKVLAGDRPGLPDACPSALKALIKSCWDSEVSARPSFDKLCADLRGLKLVLMAGMAF